MTSPLDELILYRRNRAHETFKEAETLAANNHFRGTANRMYYACFYAVNALLLRDGLSAVKHSGVRSLFNRQYIKTEIISADAGVLYNTLFDIRQTSDYEDMFVIDAEKINSMMPRVKAFLQEIERQFSNQ
jgi:uncharacterized protein (UPF0332 family)